MEEGAQGLSIRTAGCGGWQPSGCCGVRGHHLGSRGRRTGNVRCCSQSANKSAYRQREQHGIVRVGEHAAPRAALRFAETWGLLSSGSEANVSDFYRTSAELSTCLHLMSADRWSELQDQVANRRVKAGHSRFEKFQLRTYQEPGNLRDFCFLHLQRLIHQKAAILRCPRCGGFFMRKRNTRQTCSDACRKALSKRRRRRGDSNGLDDTEHGRIAALWQAICDILIQPDRGRAFVSKSEGGHPPDPEFLRLIGEWMVSRIGPRTGTSAA